MNIGEMIDRVFGFMPDRTVIFSALVTFALTVAIQYVNRWLRSMTGLPWMKEENQRNRQQILQGTVQLPEDNQQAAIEAKEEIQL